MTPSLDWFEVSYLLVALALFLYLWRMDTYRVSPDGLGWQGWVRTQVGWKDILFYICVSAAWPAAAALIGFWWAMTENK